MEFDKYSKHDWLQFVIEQINILLNKFEAKIDFSYVDYPITGEMIRFSSNDLYEFYFLLCAKVGRNIIITRYDDFFTIRNIANTLYNTFNEQNAHLDK